MKRRNTDARRHSHLTAGLVTACVLLSLCWSTLAAHAQEVVAGNYCISCHDAYDARLSRAGEWRGSIASTSTRVCPGLQAEDEQLYYLERQLLASSRIATDDAALTPLYDSYARLLDAPRYSADAFAAESQLVAYRAGKIYAAASQRIEAGKRLRVLIASALVTLFLLVAFGWGLRNTLRGQRPGKWSRLWQPKPQTIGVIGLVLVLFALPLFQAPPAAVATPGVEEQTVQAELDKSSRAGAVAERSLARAWMLSQVAATWSKIDAARGQEILAEALAAEAQARADADALWGRAQAGQEAAVGSLASLDKAQLVAAELLAARNRAWALRMIATEWASVDADAAREILAEAKSVALTNPTVYGQIDLRAIAAAWQRIDPAHVVNAPKPSGVQLGPGASSTDELALSLYRAGDYGQAWDAALAIPDEWDRARAQEAIATAWGNIDAAQKIQVLPLRERALSVISGRASPFIVPPGDLAEAMRLIDQLDSEVDKAEALRKLAAESGSQEVYERALSMAAAARVRGDPLVPARASLALAQALLAEGESGERVRDALHQAYDLTVKISVKYK